jgi:acetyltransferase-like isoleucine patch superfamily enzyme
MGLLASIRYQAKLRWLRRDEYESVALREWFAQAFQVEVGLYSYGCFDRWRIPPRTRIGRYCSFAKTARIVDLDHPDSALTTHPFLYEGPDGPPVRDSWLEIGDDVWVGHNATILPGCGRIGRGAVIGAGAIVTRDVPAYGVVAGVPAKLMRLRFAPELIEAIEASQWWRMSRAELMALKAHAPDVLHAPTPERLRALEVAA